MRRLDCFDTKCYDCKKKGVGDPYLQNKKVKKIKLNNSIDWLINTWHFKFCSQRPSLLLLLIRLNRKSIFRPQTCWYYVNVKPPVALQSFFRVMTEFKFGQFCRQFRWILISSFHWLIQNINPFELSHTVRKRKSKWSQFKASMQPSIYPHTHTYSNCSNTFVVCEIRWHAISHLILTGSVSCDMLVSATFRLMTVLDRLPAGICLSSVCGLNTAVSKHSMSSSVFTATNRRFCYP